MLDRSWVYYFILFSPIAIVALVVYAVSGDGGSAVAAIVFGLIAYFVIWRFRHYPPRAALGRLLVGIVLLLVIGGYMGIRWLLSLIGY